MRGTSIAVALMLAGPLAATAIPTSASAQTTAPEAPAPRGSRGDERRALERLAGPTARLALDEDRATVRTVFGAAIPGARASFEASALAVLERFGPLFGLPSDATFVVRDVVHAHGFTIAHVARAVEGREVALASIVVRARPDGRIDLVHVDAMPSRALPWPSAEARDTALAAALVAPGFATPQLGSVRPVALPSDGVLRPALEVEVGGRQRTERARVYVDPSSAEILLVLPLVLDAMGRVYANNPTTDRAVPVDLELADLTSRDHLTGRHVRVQSCDPALADCPTVQHAVADVDGNFLFDPMPRAYDDAFAEVSAYHHTSRVVAYMSAAHGFVWTCGPTSTIDVLVNYTEAPRTPYDNAAFSPGFRGGCGFLLFGQGATEDFSYDGDVVYHEYGHAVTDAITDLGFFGNGNSPHYEPLAINEGTSDYWASAVQGNPEIAESITALEGGRGGSLRTIDDDLRCPYDLIGEGHYDGRLWSGLGWATRTALGQERTDAMFYVAVASTTGSASLTDVATAFLATAMSSESMGTITAEERGMVETAITDRGLDACARVIPLDDGRAHQGYSGSEFVTGALAHGLAPLQYSLEIPPDIISVEVDVEHATLAGQVTVHFTSGLPARSSASRITSGTQVPIGRSGTAFLDPSGGLVPCQRLYIGIESTDLRTTGQSLYSIIARMNTSGDPSIECPSITPDAGPADASTDDSSVGSDAGITSPPAGGCGCGAVGAHGSSAGWALALAALVLARARRR